MMREIKFRAWDIEKKKMYRVEAINFSGRTTVTLQYNPVIKKSLDNVYLRQFTGLLDKNGKEIYEGDIITTAEYLFIDKGVQNYVGIVEWVFAGFQIILKCVNPDKQGISDGINEALEEGELFEIIGNIYENPELGEPK